MPDLTVKIDHVALLREIRKRGYPEPTAAAILAELAGADQIAVHLYRRRRHILDRDVKILRSCIHSGLVLEISPKTEMVGTAIDIKPKRVILVEESDSLPTSEGGLDLLIHRDTVADAFNTFEGHGIGASVCIDPDPEQIRIAHKIDAPGVQFHTGVFCSAKTTLRKNRAYLQLVDAVSLARKLKLNISVGHGLCYSTVKALVRLPQIDEFYVGHSIIARAVLVGMERAVTEMLALVKNG